MGLLQTTSKREITHLFDSYERTIYRDKCAKALCGAEVSRKRMLSATAKPEGRICTRCKNKLSMITRRYMRTLEIFSKATEGE